MENENKKEVSMKNVTIVVPIFDDWDALKICLDSLIKYVSKENQILLINDMGPEWKKLEDLISLTINGNPMFKYEKNPCNIGFSETCNRAVKELDKTQNDILLLKSDTSITEGSLEEMIQVLYLNEKHGAVCPRSNNATLSTVPFKSNLERNITFKESHYIYQQIKKLLPRQAIVPTGAGVALLIKRELIDCFGLFDNIYALGNYEENDFCQRINRYGYNIVMANYAYIYNYGTKDIDVQKKILYKEYEKKLIERYPYFQKIVQDYLYNNINVIDYYADLLIDCLYVKKRILISLYELPSVYNGSTEYNLSFLKHFFELYKKKYDIYILVNRLADSFFKISDKYPRVYYPDNLIGTFHIAFVPSQIYHMDHLLILNQTCLKYIFCMQDIISIRTHHVLVQDDERREVFRKSIRYCDGMTSISEFSLNDTKDYYYKEFQSRNIETKVIYHGVDNQEINVFLKEDYYLPYEQYFIVFGNFYEHKFLKETLPYMERSQYNFIVIGMTKDKFYNTNIYGLKSGALDDEYLNYLIINSSAILFPSLYEGFGLPILNAIQFKKKIIVQKNQLNIELKKYFNYFQKNIFLYNHGEELENYFNEIIKNNECIIDENLFFKRSWLHVVIETEHFIEKILKAPFDYNKMVDRWEDLKEFELLSNFKNLSMDKIDNKWLYCCLKFKIKNKIKNILANVKNK